MSGKIVQFKIIKNVGNCWWCLVWDWSSSSSSSSSDDDWEQEHKASGCRQELLTFLSIARVSPLFSAPRYKRGGKWVRTSGDDIPERAVVAGESSDGGPLYVGRAHHEGGLYPGKVNPDHNCCYVAYGGEELSMEEYDVNI